MVSADTKLREITMQLQNAELEAYLMQVKENASDRLLKEPDELIQAAARQEKLGYTNRRIYLTAFIEEYRAQTELLNGEIAVMKKENPNA